MRRGGDKGGTCGGVEIRVGDVSVCVCASPIHTCKYKYVWRHAHQMYCACSSYQ